MKQINKNKYVKSLKFTSFQEVSEYLKNQGNIKIISFEETYGENYYCYTFYDALTKRKLFVLSFRSDENVENLNLLFWNENNLLVLDTGRSIYLIDNQLNIIESFEINSSLVGLYITHRNELLLLEEASLKLINFKGNILKEEIFDFLENFTLDNEILNIRTCSENINFDLN